MLNESGLPKGSVVRCPNGHLICEAMEDIAWGDLNWGLKFGNWRCEPPQLGGEWPRCHVCGEIVTEERFYPKED